MLVDAEQIANWESRYRAAFVNSLTGYKSANLVGTRNLEGQENLAIMSSAVHLGSHPPLIMLIVRPDESPRHTLENILASEVYTLNHVTPAMVPAAHQTAARYPRDVSEFSACGLTPGYQPGFAAPYVREASVSMGLYLREHRELSINRTHMVIGEVVWAALPDAALREDGSLALEAAQTVALSGLDTYHTTQTLKRMAYAKPDKPPSEVEG
jgi:flavin reductase (DIM6/NTAB) family NADH-FMN oxidoreductase RutF